MVSCDFEPLFHQLSRSLEFTGASGHVNLKLEPFSMLCEAPTAKEEG